jgi:hypothetical protein
MPLILMIGLTCSPDPLIDPLAQNEPVKFDYIPSVNLESLVFFSICFCLIPFDTLYTKESAPGGFKNSSR